MFLRVGVEAFGEGLEVFGGLFTFWMVFLSGLERLIDDEEVLGILTFELSNTFMLNYSTV